MTGGSGGGGTTITKTEPPAYVQPYAVQHLQNVSGLSQVPYQLYQGQFVQPTFGPSPSQPGGVPTQQQQAARLPLLPRLLGGQFGGQPAAAAPAQGRGQITGYETLPQSSVDQFLQARLQGFTPEQEQALGLTSQRALAGSPVMNAAQQNLLGTLRGDYLQSNPYLDDIVNRTQRDVMTQMGPAFVRSGSTGNTGLAQVTAQQMADASNALRFQNYDAERQRQMQANLFAPQMAGADYQDLQALMGVGDIRQQMGQTQKDLAYQEFLNQIGYPYQQADVLGNAVSQATGGITSQTGPNSYNRAAGALGGALGGAGLYSALSSNPIAWSNPWSLAAIGGGALLGGLL